MPDEERLEKLGHFIRESGTDAVLNLGDTVSRKPLLLDEYPTLESGFALYLKWRRSLGIPFAECAIARELEFFPRIMGQEVDQLFELDHNSAIITLLQQKPCRLDVTQEEFVINALEKCQGKTVVIGTHQPFGGSCSREGDVFLKVTGSFRKLLEDFSGRIIWCGGHFHWENEPPAVTGSLTALYASRFRIISRDDTSYTSTIDTATGKITVDFHNF
jgi:hypothetical protein